MEDQNIKFRVGVMVLASLFILGILVMLVGEVPSLVRGAYRVHVRFREAPGVGIDTPVRKSGLRIGRVSDVRFDESNEGVIVTVRIDSNVELRRSDACRISGRLLGDSVVQFVPAGKPGARKELLTDGETISGEVAGGGLDAIGNLEGNLSRAITSVATAGDEIGRLAKTVNVFFEQNDGKIQRLVDQTEHSLQAFEETLTSVNKILGDERVAADLKQAVAEVPAFLRDVRKAVQGVQEAVDLAGENLRNLQGFTKPLGARGSDVVDNINRSISRLDEVLENIARFSRNLTEQRGSLARFVQDPELYDRLNRTATNIEQLTLELKPIVRDARLFSSKIAAHPELLGVRGAIKPSSGLK